MSVRAGSIILYHDGMGRYELVSVAVMCYCNRSFMLWLTVVMSCAVARMGRCQGVVRQPHVGFDFPAVPLGCLYRHVAVLGHTWSLSIFAYLVHALAYIHIVSRQDCLHCAVICSPHTLKAM